MVRSFVAVVLLFFFKQKTAYEMRISDWSSDVCSSDLKPRLPSQARALVPAGPAAAPAPAHAAASVFQEPCRSRDIRCSSARRRARTPTPAPFAERPHGGRGNSPPPIRRGGEPALAAGADHRRPPPGAALRRPLRLRVGDPPPTPRP